MGLRRAEPAGEAGGERPGGPSRSTQGRPRGLWSVPSTGSGPAQDGNVYHKGEFITPMVLWISTAVIGRGAAFVQGNDSTFDVGRSDFAGFDTCSASRAEVSGKRCHGGLNTARAMGQAQRREGHFR